MAAAPDASAQAAAPVVLEIDAVTKRFGALAANDAISLTLRRGEVLALLGENGAGKTTLMNILFGHYVADEGEIRVAGADGRLEALSPGSPQAALEAGIGMVHQHFTLAENLTGFENIILGVEPLFGLARSRRQAREEVERLIADSGLVVDMDVRVSSLTVGEKQRVEILKALFRKARILVLDEPTAVLTPQESDGLFQTVARLAAGGLSVVFISHKLAEVLAASDRIAVLRGGRLVGELETAGAGRAKLAELMVGREVPESRRTPLEPGAVVLGLEDVHVDGADVRRTLHDATLAVHECEIVGIAGVAGNGQSALAALLSGLAIPASGGVSVLGRRITEFSPQAFKAAGIGRIPEDRHHDGVIGAMTVSENLALESLGDERFARAGFLRSSGFNAYANEVIRAYDVRCPGPQAPARLLSGGNMQKLILARVLDAEPKLILANQPSRGLDVGAQAEVHRRLFAARERSAGVVLISEDLDELFTLADRIVVIHAGHLVEAGAVEDLDRGTVGLMMAGHAPEALAS